MPDGFGNDAFQWKNSSHKVTSYGVGGKISRTTDNTDRDVEHVRDQTTQLLKPEVFDCITETTLQYCQHFNTGITIEHREEQVACAEAYCQYADELLDSITAQEQDIADRERLELEQQLCQLRDELNLIAGSTRNCFSAGTIARTLSENSIKVTGMLAELRNDAIKQQTAAKQVCCELGYKARIEADQLDFEKYTGVLQLLRGAWNKVDFTDTIDEEIDRTTTNFTITTQWNRTAGSISDADGTYNDEYDNLNTAAGDAALSPDAVTGGGDTTNPGDGSTGGGGTGGGVDPGPGQGGGAQQGT